MGKLTPEELRACIKTIHVATDPDDLRQIREALNQALEHRVRTSIRQFRSGQQVEFTGKYGILVKGVVVRVKSKNVEVRSVNGQLWNVTATLLSPTKTEVKEL